MKKFILFFFALVASVCAFAQGTADFNTLEQTTKYAEYTTTQGWVATNSAVFVGHAGTADDDSAPKFAVFGEGTKAVCINGKTSAVGKITSPVLEGGCGTLSFNYAYVYSEKNGVSFHVAILQNGAAVAEYDVIDNDLKQKVAGTWSQKVAVPGDFQIVITNNSPSQDEKSNKDRYCIYNLEWTAQAPLPVKPLVATVTAVFPNGNKHVVFSNGTKLTAGAEAPADAISTFDVVSRTENTLVLKAGDQYLHWTSGDNTSKSADLDGLNEEFDEDLNTLILAPATLQGCNTTASWGKTEEDVEGLYRLQGKGTNGSVFDFTLRENDDAWIAGDPGMFFFDTNWDGNGCRTSFFEIVVAEAGAAEVDFEKVNVAAIKQADFVEPGKWYLLKQKRGGVSPVYDAGVGETMKRAANDKVVVAGTDAADAVNYLLRFIPASEGAYNLQFANGHYWASTMTTTEEEPGEYNVYNINGAATHIGINLYNMDKIVDNNGAGNTLAFWESGEVTKLDGNNDWTVWEVEFAEKSTAAAELKALLTEVEAVYNANNVVVEVGEGIITSTDQFSSPYTCGQNMEPGSGTQNLLDMDGKTYWHSDWSSAVDSHYHYLQVEFAEPISGAFEFNMNRRVNGSSLCANDNPVKMSVETSLDGEEFVLADEFETPFTQTAAAPLVQATVNIPTPAKYLRFFNDESNGDNQRGYWHCGDLQLKPIVVPAPNAAYPEAAAAFAEALAAAKEAGANATGADVAALQAAYEAYLKGLQPAPAAPEYLTAAQVREKAATGRFAILGVTSTGDHYINGEAGTGHVSADGTLAGVRNPEANEIVYLVQNGEKYNIQRECDGKYFQVNAGADIVLVDSVADATPFFVYGKDDAAYGPVSGYADLFSDIEATTNDLMVRFVANNQWLNGQGCDKIGGLRGGTGAWSFQYVRYMGEKEVVTPEPTAVTFEFTDNEDGTITITPSDLKALYFFNIYSDRINTEYQQGTDAEAIAGDVAQNLTAPEYEVHTGVSVVDPAEWLEYWFGGYVKYTEGDYRLGVVELAYNGTYSMGGEPVFHAFTKAAAEPEVKSNEFVTDGKVYTLTAVTKAGAEYAWTVQNGEVVPVLNGTPAKFTCEFHGDNVAFVTEDGKYLRNHDCDPSTATWYTDKSATGIDNEYSELCNLVFEHFPATAANVDAGYGDVTADLVAVKAARGHRTDNGLIAEGYFIMNSNGTFSGAATTAPFFKDGYTSAFRLVEYVEEVPETFPMEGVAYKFKNVDSQLYVKVIDDAEQCVTLGQTPDEMFFTAVEGGWAISTSKGYVLGATAKGWNIGNTATPIVWTIEEVEGGYAFKNEKGYLGYDTAAAGQKAFRDKNYSTHHGIFNIWKYDEEEIIVVPDKTLEETWENIHNLLAEAEAIKELNEVTVTYDRDGYFEDFTSPIVGKVGYKKHDDVWAVCDGADYVNDFVSYFESAAEADAYLADFGGIAALEEIITNVIDDYNAAEVVLPTPGKTYVIRNYPYTYGNEYSYAYYYNGSKLALSECANATTAEYMWTVSEPVNYSYFDADLNVISETRYQFVNAADETKFMSWRGAGTDNYAGVTTNAADANSKWYLTGKKVDGSATPAYGTLALRTNADGNQYRTAVVDMRKSTDHLSKSNGDHFDATYSSWFIFEEVEIPVTEWDGNEPIVEVNKDATTVKVTFTDAHSVEASHFGVLGAIFDEQGDVTAIVFNDLFGDTVEFGKDCATLHFKKISDINAELAEAAKGMASKVTAAANGDTKGKVVICSKSFKIDGDYIYNETIVRDFEFAGNITGIDAIATDANTKVFDLQGRRVVLPAKGVFVKDGRKVVK